MKYIDAEKLKAEIKKRIKELDRDKYISVDSKTTRIAELHFIDRCTDFLQQEQPDFDDVDPKHLVHTHYRKVRDTKTGRVFFAEYSSEAAEWYEKGNGRPYSSAYVEIVQEQPEVDLEKDIKTFTAKKLLLPITGNQREPMDITEGDWVACAYHFYELGLNAKKEE